MSGLSASNLVSRLSQFNLLEISITPSDSSKPACSVTNIRNILHMVPIRAHSRCPTSRSSAILRTIKDDNLR